MVGGSVMAASCYSVFRTACLNQASSSSSVIVLWMIVLSRCWKKRVS